MQSPFEMLSALPWWEQAGIVALGIVAWIGGLQFMKWAYRNLR